MRGGLEEWRAEEREEKKIREGRGQQKKEESGKETSCLQIKHPVSGTSAGRTSLVSERGEQL